MAPLYQPTQKENYGREQTIKLTSIKIKKEVAELVRIYCLFNNIKMADFSSEILEKRLKEFKENLERLRKIK